MMKKLGFAVLTAAAVAGMTVTAFAGTWQNTAKGWKYKNDDGTYKKNEVFYDETDGEYYLFDTNGIMVTGDITSNGVSYFFREDGSMARNTYFSDTKEVATEDGSIVKAGTDTFVVGEVVTFHEDGDVIYVTVANFSGKPLTVQNYVELTGNGMDEVWYAYDSETDTLGKEFVLKPMDQMRIPFIAEDGSENFPGWSLDALKYIYEGRNAAANGHEALDTDASAEAAKAGDLACERYVLEKGKLQIEVLCNLDQVAPAGAILFAAWPRIEGATGLPVRVWAVTE